MSLDDVDLSDLAERIRRHIPPTEPPVGYLRGRSYFRDVIVHELRCSELEAEVLVDTLEMNGYLRFEGDPSARRTPDLDATGRDDEIIRRDLQGGRGALQQQLACASSDPGRRVANLQRGP